MFPLAALVGLISVLLRGIELSRLQINAASDLSGSYLLHH